MVVVGVVVLLVVGFVAMTLLSSGGNAEKDDLIKAAQQQAELIRVSKIGVEKARDPITQSLAITTSLALESDQITLLSHAKVSSSELALGRSSKTDVALTTAEQSNEFDTVFTQTIQTELLQYQTSLRNAYSKASSTKLKTSLKELIAHAGVLTAKK